MSFEQLFLLNFDKNPHSVLEPNHEKLPYHFPEKLLYAFVPKSNIDAFLKKYPHKKLGSFETISFTPDVYEVEIDNQKITFCQAPLGAPAATQLLDWLISYGVREVLAIGNAGTLVDLPENKMFIVKEALRDEGTSAHYLPVEDFVELDSNFYKKIQEALEEQKLETDFVTTWTTDGFFRETIEKVKTAQKLGCELVEMECAAMASCSMFRGVKFGQLLFTADSLANLDKYDERDWGNDSYNKGLEIGLNVLSKL